MITAMFIICSGILQTMSTGFLLCTGMLFVFVSICVCMYLYLLTVA